MNRKSIIVGIVSVLFASGFALAADTGTGVITVPPPDTITSADGNITVGVSRRFGGAIAYYADKRIGNDPAHANNMIDYYQGGALLSTAIWTLPIDTNEQQLCYDAQKVNGLCPATVPFHNPTQGGYAGNGWAGNPNPSTVTVSGNTITTSYRGVNFNDEWNPVVPLTVANQNEWQTDFWGDVKISFHPTIPNVVVVETKITYCKDMNSGCSSTPSVTEDNQLSTFFSLGASRYPDPTFVGPYTRVAYYKDGAGYQISAPPAGSVLAAGNSENWAAILQSSTDSGVGMSVEQYMPTDPTRFGYVLTPGATMLADQPEINRFQSSGVTRVTSVVIGGHDYNDIPRYQFQPGGWYSFKTYYATGDLDTIRNSLLQAQGLISAPATPAPEPTIPLPPTPEQFGLHEGDTISAANSSDPDIYIINQYGYKRLFLNPIIFQFYGHLGGFQNVKTVAAPTRDAFATSTLFTNCETGDPKVYALEVTGEDTGTLHWLNMDGALAAAQDPNFSKKVFCINNNEYNWYTQGSPYSALSQIPPYYRK